MVSIEKVAKAFSDKNRLKIMQMLIDGQMNVSDVADTLNVEENLASHHLRVLSSLGYLKSDKKGREVYYKVNETKVISLIKDLNKNPIFKDLLKRALDNKSS
jgi:DNA-binding transcriptional ArsR family regulator